MVLPWRRRHYRLHIWLQHPSLQNCKHPWPAVCSMLWCLPSSTPNKRSGQYKLNNSQHTSGPLSAITVGDIMILFSFSPPTLLPVAFYWDLLLLFFFFFFLETFKGGLFSSAHFPSLTSHPHSLDLAIFKISTAENHLLLLSHLQDKVQRALQ